ncbi:MAG TPA: hypothetical protein VMB75_00930 [Rhodocyclaceae bacterium]|nr:hypothetical protein [Rhodocyclaceae bacterium]
MMRLAAAVASLLGLPAAAQTNLSLTLAPESDSQRRDSPYFVGPPLVPMAERSLRSDLELRYRQGGFNAQGILRQQAFAGVAPERHGIANQFYYDGDLGDGWGWTAGKKVLAWGVGFGFRPLDVVQREDRRGVNLPPLVGVPLLAVERFTADAAWTLAWTRPGQGGGDDNAGDGRDSALALHWYRYSGGDDLHAVARLSHRRGLEAGFGATRVIGEEWSIYGAALYQRRYTKSLNALAENGGLLAAADPMTQVVRHDGVKAVAGAQWTGASGWSWLAEGWYDADAYGIAEWRHLDALTARQLAMAGLAPAQAVAGNVGWSSQAYLASNLLRGNLLLRLSHDDGDGFKPYAELLATPADGGKVLTLGAAWEGNRQQLTMGLRRLGGAGESIYARAPLKGMAWAQWRIAFF